MRKFKNIWIGLTVISLIQVLIFNNCERNKNPLDNNGNSNGSDTTVSKWYEVESPTDESLYSVHFMNPEDGWAVGHRGTIIHYNGTQWQLVDSPTKSRLNDVYFIASNDGWAVGDSGVIVHYNGTDWQNVSTFDSTNNWTSVYFVSQVNGYICNLQGSIVYYDGVNWELNYHIYGAGWQSLYFTSEDEGWVVGYKGKSYYKYGMWNHVDSLNFCFNDVFMLSATSGWVTSSPAKSGPNSALTWHYNGTEWNLVDNPAPDDSWGLPGIYFTDENNGWAVGGRGSEEENKSRGYIMYYNGISWTLIENSISDYLQSVYFLSQNEGWAVGWNGIILYYGN